MMISSGVFQFLCSRGGTKFIRRAFSLENNDKKKTVLVLGSSGALGSSIVKQLSNDCHILGVDINPPRLSNDDSTCFFDFIPIPSTNALQSTLMENMNHIPNKLDAIICANGGFAMDNFHDDVAAEMMQVNYEPVVAAVNLLPKFIAPQGKNIFFYIHETFKRVIIFFF